MCARLAGWQMRRQILSHEGQLLGLLPEGICQGLRLPSNHLMVASPASCKSRAIA